MSKRHHTNSINHVEIPASIRRDVILDGDTTFQENARALNERAAQRKIDPEQYRAIHEWQVQASLRRAHIPRTDADNLIHA